MGEMAFFFVVVDRHRKVRPHLYQTLRRAERYATGEGDSVIEVRVDFGKRPLFIRGEVVGE